MAGPAPKLKDRRTNRNQKARGEWVTLPDDRVEVPELPELEVAWRVKTVELWESWWGSPMANMWDDGDFSGILRLAMLWNDLLRGQLGQTAQGELRQLETLYGLNPEGRKKLRWLLPGEEEVELAEVRTLSSAKGDPRKKKK